MKKILLLSLISLSIAYSECEGLDWSECMQFYPLYCIWNYDTEECEDNTEGEVDLGPYTVGILYESDGLRNGPEYSGATLYYPIDGISPFIRCSIGTIN